MTSVQKVLITGAVVAVAFLFGWRIGHGTKQTPTASQNSGGQSDVIEPTPNPLAKPVEADGADGYELSAASSLPRFQRISDFAAFLAAAKASQLGDIYASLRDVERWGLEVDLEIELFLDWAAHTDPQAALALIRADGLERRFGERFFKAWAVGNAAEVLAELEKSVTDRDRWGVAVYGVLAAMNDPNASKLAELLGPEFERQIALADANAFIRREGLDASVESITAKLESLANARRFSLSNEMAPFWMATKLSTSAIKDLVEGTLRSNPELAKADRMTTMWAGPLVSELAKRDPRETMNWLLNSEQAESLTPMMNDAMREWAKADMDGALDYIQTTQMAPERQLKLLLGIVNSGGAGDSALVEDAWKLIHELKGESN